MLNTRTSTQVTVKGALLVAIAFIFTYFEFPILPSVPWLKLDFSMVPLLLGALALGPGTGVLLTALLQVILFATKSSTGGVGEIANFIVISTMIVVVSLVYKKHRNLTGLVTGLLLGTLGFTLAAVLANKFILVPLFFPGEFPGGQAAYETYLYRMVPLFNAIKGVSVALLSALLYSRLERFLKVESSKSVSQLENTRLRKAN
ncbi:ECF transporter S component [Proteiniclasticum sp. QWL-01]|uniref:ECF transporter S component n=1 Tax=Proteiniclasticum sp. QWL-01 TaxID=3036945 RepID=UPI002201D894|nr:ECF transporter S component [Proteiniclasticum sp. QWL-01]UUM13213.1 ECF transporter S component [Clostridiaceae bacterium HFYG-1003]WFF71639.1 ECF transporter S component [Proteiniclasticum sp. QWL-01]